MDKATLEAKLKSAKVTIDGREYVPSVALTATGVTLSVNVTAFEAVTDDEKKLALLTVADIRNERFKAKNATKMGIRL